MVEPPRTRWELPCWPPFPFITEVWCGRTTPNSLEITLQACFPLHHRGLVWSNHPELILNCPVGLLTATQWFEEVRCGRTTPNSLEPTQ